MTRRKPYVLRAAIKRRDGVYWRTLAYCEGCGTRMGLTKRPTWCRLRIRLPEFRRNAICSQCLAARQRRLLVRIG
jgi:hypothetical protein